VLALALPSPVFAASKGARLSQASPAPTKAQADLEACSDAAAESKGGSECGSTKVSGATSRALKTVTSGKG
jgi:hypothetical protein